MVDRVLFTADTIKVSKPGYDVNTAAAQDLCWDGSAPGLGVYMTGVVTVAPDSSETVNFGATLSYIPWCICQWKVDNNTAWGGGSMYHIYHEGEDLYLDPGETHVSYPIPEGCKGITWQPTYSQLHITNVDVTNALVVKYVVFYNEAGTSTTPPGAVDRTPDFVNWHNITGNGIALVTNEQTISGLAEAINLRVTTSAAMPSNTYLEVVKNGSVTATVTTGNTIANFTGTNGDVFYFRKNGTGSVTTLNAVVRNLSTNTDLDAFGIDTTNFADTTPNAFSFTDVTNAILTNLYTSNNVTITGIDTGTIISLVGTGEYSINGGYWRTGNDYVYNGNYVTLRLTSSGSYATTISTVLYVGDVSDTWSVTTPSAPSMAGNISVGSASYTYSGPWGNQYSNITFNATANITSGGSGSYTYAWTIHSYVTGNAFLLNETSATCSARTSTLMGEPPDPENPIEIGDPPPDTSYDEIVLRCVVTDTSNSNTLTLFSSTIVFS